MTENPQWHERLQHVMPFGASTCSKAPKLLPEEPAVIVRGKGCRVWDADGREFIDFRNSLGPITLGYCFPAVDRAIREQLDCGIVFGHPHPLECEVAETICEVIPCAEQARFLKTGGEAMAACFRIARTFTGRERIVQIGYNGWLNSVAAGGRQLPNQVSADAPPGVPAALSALHHACPWADIAAVREVFDRHPGEVAAVAVAASYHDMEKGRDYYPTLRQLCDERGALLVYDEIVSGFRVALAGVQEYFGVTPDLAVFAKGVANGMPLSVYCGRREAMEAVRKGVVSSTYGGETLSLAAAKATIATYREQGVIAHLWRQGEKWSAGGNEVFERHGLPVRLRGMAPCPRLQWEGEAPAGLEEKLWRAMYRNGLSLYAVTYVNFSHADTDIAEALERLDAACSEAARG